jgi:uncharacterized protein YdbL (DUF1318 family)
MMKKSLITSFFFTLMFSLPVLALSLTQAKQQGLVGEIATGYIGVVKPSPAATQLVQKINVERRKAYEKNCE